MIEIKKTGICEGCVEANLELVDYRDSCFDKHDWRLLCKYHDACERIEKIFMKDGKTNAFCEKHTAQTLER